VITKLTVIINLYNNRITGQFVVHPSSSMNAGFSGADQRGWMHDGYYCPRGLSKLYHFYSDGFCLGKEMVVSNYLVCTYDECGQILAKI
jgi:hypothetical protein